MILIDPLSIFFYSWRYLAILEKEETNKYLKLIYRWSAVATMLLPISLLGVYCAFVYKTSTFLYYTANFEPIQALALQTLCDSLSTALGYISLACNLFSCVVIALVLRLLHKISQKVVLKTQNVDNQISLNKLVTISHITLIFGYSIVSTLCLNGKFLSAEARLRTATAFGVFGGVANVFLAVMLWFIIDDEKRPIIFREGERAYEVIDVIKYDNHSSVSLNLDLDLEVEPAEQRASVADTSFQVGERMIAQFFDESKTLDEDWYSDFENL